MDSSATLARGLAATRTQTAHHAYLEQLGDALSYLLDPDEVLRELARRVVPEMADYCVTYVAEPESIRRVGVAHADPTLDGVLARLLDAAAPTSEDAWGAGAAIRTGEPIVAFDIPPESVDRLPETHDYRRLIQILGPTSSFVLPLRARGQIVGAVSFATTAHSGLQYELEDLALAKDIARRAAVALDNARLYVESQREVRRREDVEATLRGRYEQLQIVYQMTQAVSTAGAADAIYAEALRALEQGVGADRASIRLFDSNGVMRFKAWTRLSEEYRAKVEEYWPWATDAADPEPIFIPDVEADDSLSAEVRETVLREGIRALAFIPLLSGGRLLGKFMLYFDRPHAPLREEVDLANTIAHTIAFAIARMEDEQHILAAKEAAERASQAKSQFLGVMSHELRTPLNSVYGYTELLLLGTKGPLNESQAEYVRRIQASAAHQLKLIEELLTYTRLEAGWGDVRLMTTDVRRIVTDVLEFVRPEAERKGLALRPVLPDSKLETTTDPARLRQIVLNLVGNATKFTEAGEIVVRAYRVDGCVSVDVMDTGPGIPATELERIWEPFAQVEAKHRPGTGTGLGLSIARKFAELLGARISVESDLGSGSTFTVQLPPQS